MEIWLSCRDCGECPDRIDLFVGHEKEKVLVRAQTFEEIFEKVNFFGKSGNFFRFAASKICEAEQTKNQAKF